MAAGRQLGPTDLKRLNRGWRHRTDARISLVLDSVTSPFNVGSILRSAAALGVEQVWLCGATATPQHPSTRKTSMGTERLVRWDVVATAVEAIALAREDDLKVVAVELAEGAVPLHEADLGGDVCLLVGNEDKGCSPAVLAAVDLVTFIPQVGKVGSLNVAVAVGIALADARRREWSTPAVALPDAETATP